MSNIWDKIAEETAKKTDKKFASKISGLTHLNDREIEALILETGISQQDLAQVLKVLSDATQSNQAKANSLKNINKALEVLTALAGKVI